MSYVGKKFPDLAVSAVNVMGDSSSVNVLREALINQKKILLFWYPKDFTFVCPTEFHAFQGALHEFKKRNTIVIGASCDTAEVHFAWLNTPKEKGGIEGVTFNLLADTNRNLSTILDILDIESIERNEELDANIITGDAVTYRATYLIDEEGTVFHEGINAMPLGRNVNEFLRLIDAWSHNQKHGEVCPANWAEGEDALNANPDSVAEYLSTH
ncbi:MAG: peroxiredoxin [Cytophagales bacterium]|nr:peroxiredoxin [Cytophagales bacterium]